MKTFQNKLPAILSILTLSLLSQQAHAAIALDRTRVVFDGDKSSMTVAITNQNKSLPYLGLC